MDNDLKKKKKKPPHQINAHLSSAICLYFLFYLFIHEKQREREREREAEGEAGSMQGAQRVTLYRVSRIMPWAEGGAKPLSHPGCPLSALIFFFFKIYLFIHEKHRE